MTIKQLQEDNAALTKTLGSMVSLLREIELRCKWKDGGVVVFEHNDLQPKVTARIEEYKKAILI